MHIVEFVHGIGLLVGRVGLALELPIDSLRPQEPLKRLPGSEEWLQVHRGATAVLRLGLRREIDDCNLFLLLDAEPELREPLGLRLERYIVADDVENNESIPFNSFVSIGTPITGMVVWLATTPAR